MAFEIGDKVKPTLNYLEDLEEPNYSILDLLGEVIDVFEGVYHVCFPEAPYFKDYWIMYEDEIELVKEN